MQYLCCHSGNGATSDTKVQHSSIGRSLGILLSVFVMAVAVEDQALPVSLHMDHQGQFGCQRPETLSFFPFSPLFERLNISNIPSPATVSNGKMTLQAETWQPFRQELEGSKNPIDIL